MSDKVLGWLWLPAHTKVRVGQTLTIGGCGALDALKYASGPVICRIGLSGEVLAMADAMIVLHEFMCWCAEQALLREREAGREPDPRSWKAIEVKRKWMKGEATDEELSIASDAAWDASRSAFRTATRDAAWKTAWAAWSAAWSTAWDAAWIAAWTAAWTATWGFWGASWDGTSNSQNAKLEEMLNDLLKEGEGEK